MTRAVRFIHAADLHLDAPFKGVDAADPRVREALVASTYDALGALVSACLDNQVDFLVLSGDVYNAAERSLRAEFAFRDACVRLAEAGIRVFVARGNHDPSSGWSANLPLPAEVHIFSDRMVERVTFERDGETLCALYGRSFRTANETGNLALGFRRDPSDPLAIGVLHANVGGQPGHEPYAPCSLADLRGAHMDYWALGHIHLPGDLADDPPVVYPGCAQGLSPNESGPRGCRLVTLGDDGVASEFVPTAAVLWTRAVVPLDEAAGLDEMRAALGSAIDAAAREADGVPVIARLELTGRSAAHAELARPGVLGDLLDDVRTDGLQRDGWVWVGRLLDRTRPALDLDAVRAGEDFAGDFVRMTDALLASPEAAETFVAEAARQVLGTLDARDVPELDARSLVERARDLALDRLAAGDDR